MTKKRTGKEISPAAQAAIADRVRLARPDMLSDIRTILASRGGRATVDQLDTLARLIAADVPANTLLGALVEIFAQCRVERSTSAPWWADRYDALFAAVEAAERGDADPPPAPTIDQCRDALLVTDEEAVELGLRTLVSEQVRSARRRAAVGAEPGTVGRPRGDRPWEAAGVSKATWFRRLARQTAEEERVVAAEIQSVAAGETKSDPICNYEIPPQAVGSDSPLYDSLRIGSNFVSLPPARPGGGFGAPVAVKPLSQVEARLAYIGTWPTEEALRLVALAARYGLWWADDPYDIKAWRSETWFATPDGVTLTSDQEVALVIACKAADGGEKHDRGHARAERLFHARGREESARWNKRPLNQRIAIERKRKQDEAKKLETPDGRPHSVSQAVWDAVPVDWRDEVLRLAGLNFVYGYAPDEAVLRAVWTYRRDLDRLGADGGGADDDDPEVADDPAPVALCDNPRYGELVRCIRFAIRDLLGRDAARDPSLREPAVAEALRLAEATPGLVERWEKDEWFGEYMVRRISRVPRIRPAGHPGRVPAAPVSAVPAAIADEAREPRGRPRAAPRNRPGRRL